MKKLLTILCILLIYNEISGQLTPMSNQYLLNPLTLNPAYSGIRGALNVAAFYRRQWTGVKGSPETLTFTADAPLRGDKVGLGFMIVSDRIGVIKESQFMSHYAYRIAFGDAILSFGLGAGLTITNTAFSDLIVLDAGDEIYLANSRVFVVPEVTSGLCFSYKNYFVGFSIPKLLSYQFDFNDNKYSANPHFSNYNYLFNTGLLIDINKRFKFFPSVLVNYSPGKTLLYDLNAHFNILEKFWFGSSYRNNRSVTGLIQFQVNNQLRIAYSYDFELGKLGSYSNGSHEIMLRYEFRYKANLSNPLVF